MNRWTRNDRWWPPCAAALLLLPLAFPACVTRTLTIRTEPAGASVHLDGRLVGTTPYTETFLSYGVRQVDLRLQGHERIVAEIDVWRPWWQYFPIDVFADLLWPFPLDDLREFSFALAPRVANPPDWEEARAAYDRLRNLRGRLGPR